MNIDEINDFHYITPISNIRSILKYGILSHNHAKKISHASLAMSEIQDIRARKRIPGGTMLHDYANLYFCARNPMLFKRKEQHQKFCVLQIDPEVLHLPEVIIADGNASSDYTGFWSFPDGLQKLKWETVFAEYWTDENEIIYWHKKRVKCAEILIPDKLEPQYIMGAYVSCEESESTLRALDFNRPITINKHLFFR